MKVKTPNVKLWWFVLNNSKRKRWLVKNLKQFIKENNGYSTGRWHDWDVRNLYTSLLTYHRASQWVISKPTPSQIINVAGSTPGRTYCKELPYKQAEFREYVDFGITTQIKNFWSDIDFNI